MPQPKGVDPARVPILTRARPWVSALVVGWGLAAAIGHAQAPEYDVKASFLNNLTKFVEWPADQLGDPASPFRLCIYGNDPFGPTLDRTIAGNAVGSHPVVVERLRRTRNLGACAMLFVPASAQQRAAAILRATRSRAVLTIGESPGFLERGGMIRFVVVGGEVRFDINPQAIAAHRLTVSSKLLRVARRTVTGTGTP